ncbi:calcium-binding protein [Thalassobius sp. I31.1]|uniref:calcium-binding protein n=1 Tax=Thalassobius sp. I31.1 TaxID=2109912 RepID=UPI000D1AE853|nr:calcium-binding protein [Thalassobius sp. I31.1]
MATLTIGSTPVGFPVGFAYSHLQVIHDSGLELEVVGERADGQWDIRAAYQPAPYPDGYLTTYEIDLGEDRTSEQVWGILNQVTNQFIAAQNTGEVSLNYSALTYNSNTFVSTLLYVVGINVSNYIPSYEHLGSTGNALFWESDSPDLQLHGYEDNDIIRSGWGDDHLFGMDGNDNLQGANGDDILEGGNGDDLLYGGRDDDILSGGSGQDELQGGLGDDQLDGGSGNDILSGGDGDDVLDGGAGSDIIFGGDGSDSLQMGFGETLISEGGKISP